MNGLIVISWLLGVIFIWRRYKDDKKRIRYMWKLLYVITIVAIIVTFVVSYLTVKFGW